jgi:hypothetical protein
MLAILFFNGCTTTRKMELTAAASPDQKTDPYGAVVSEKKHMVSLLLYEEIYYIRDNAIFNLIVENRGEGPFTIRNENISVIFEGHDKKRTVKKLDVQSEKEFMNDFEYEYRKRLINDLVQIGKSKDYISAPSLGGENSMDKFYVVFPSGNYDTSNRVLRLARNTRSLKTLRETIPDLIFDQKTIIPHESISALISFRTDEIPQRIEGNFKITVSIDGEAHRFTVTLK